MSKYDYSQCWANCLGDCDRGMSREHIVSECLFDRQVKVKGLPWCKEEKTIGIGALTSTILCAKHNSALSDTDTAARQTLDTFREAVDLWLRRKDAVTKSWSFKPHFTTDMLLLERWCLKTLININLNRNPGLPIDAGGTSPIPSLDLVRIAFGLDRFVKPMGLYRIAVGGDAMEIGDEHIHVVTKSRNDILVGAEFTLWGMWFYLSIIPDEIRWEGGHLMRGQHKQWFCTRDRKNREVKSHLMTFIYPPFNPVQPSA